ncbi:TetR/AcrR family transcriptional regulator [Nocardioides sp. zg-ZUI104]|uniref:TetR/AcrR family transcriptional regulator n=1 Tax=Nocardioides faecalis TaxID=2803858 RepID=UPI001BCB0C14|nr:TetR/AcrR family transcriptional regulator [Nocardioides faecalis]MBS4754608.1 TetR/AcrR family transcriptional regulator [Nocardioides faecalis]
MTATTGRKRMTGEDRREQILDILLEIVDADGFPAATPRRVAEAAGVSRAVLYQQFGDMGGLCVALVDREFARMRDQFAHGVAALEVTEPSAVFLGAFRVALDALAAAPATWRLFLFPPQGAPPALHARLEESEAIIRAFLRHGLELAFPDTPDPEYVARLVHVSGRELLRMRLEEPENATEERLLALIDHLVAQASAPEVRER